MDYLHAGTKPADKMASAWHLQFDEELLNAVETGVQQTTVVEMQV